MKKILAVLALLALGSINIYAEKTAGDVYNSGYDLYLVNNYKAAVKLFKKAIKMEPEFVKPYNMAGLSYCHEKGGSRFVYVQTGGIYRPGFCRGIL
jgi:tetratricopeptide (TPR) repeat protein